MTPRLTILILAAMVAGGCSDPSTVKTPDDPKSSINVGADVVTIRGCEYIKAMQYGGYVYTHLGNCTNHAPTVVTQYVDRVVTQECQRQHWSYIAEPDPGITLPSPAPLRWSTNGYWVVPNKWLGDGEIVTNDAGGVEK